MAVVRDSFCRLHFARKEFVRTIHYVLIYPRRTRGGIRLAGGMVTAFNTEGVAVHPHYR